MAIPPMEVRITADTTDAEAGLKRVSKSAQAAARGFQSTSKHVDKYSGAVQRGTGHTANIAAQFNDIGMMMASGQSPFLLAAQQGTQLSQVLNQMGGGKNALKGLAAGFMSIINPTSLLTLGLIAGSAALVQWAFSASEADKEAERLEERVKNLDEYTAKLNEELRQLRLGVTEEELTLTDMMAQKLAEIERIEQGIEARKGRNVRGAQQTLAALRAEYAEMQRQLQSLQNAQAERETLVNLARQTADQERMLGDQMQFTASQLQESEAIAELLRQGLSASAIEALTLADVDIASGIDAATASAAQLAANLHISLQEALKLRAMSNDPLDAFGGAGRFIPTDAPAWNSEEALRFAGVYSGGGGRSGGGGGGSAYAGNARLESLIDSLKTEREIIEEWHSESLGLLQSANAAELEALGGHNEARLRLEEEYQERLRGIQGAYQGTRLQNMGEFMGAMSDAMQSGNEKMLKVAKVFSSAQALINSYQAYTEVLKDPSLPWFARIPAAVGVLSAGLGMVSAIKGVSSGGGGASAGAGGAAAQSQAPAQVSLNTIGDGEFIRRSDLGDLADSLFELYGDRGYVLQVAG